ncbi:tetratricopeptide repeat protein [Porphyrobacter algicida]|uniref:Tetratricopeptide repeat protein n=1 Tax=Qipengyuania algicida TaxID=1836209 RepID=A0A845AJE0_9SPHN|nr:retropepsin-like aspartic protease [Qipengyuania algicida]MXP29527.1 tetratricopeptide repeat protein [Qipengyuania algicida]
MDGLSASVPVTVNGHKTTFWLDSGAWFSIMSNAKAQELGLRIDQAPRGLMMSGIGGSFRPEVTTISDFAINGSVLHRVDFIVGGSDAGSGLIGRNLLANFDTEFDIAHGSVSIVRPEGDCKHVNFGYWSKSQLPFTVKLLRGEGNGKINDFALPVMLNGKEVEAEIDSGAITLISRRAAERAGIDLDGPDAIPIERLSGFGRHFEKGWSVRLKSVSIGDETILNPRLTVIDGPIVDGPNAPDMLLGIGYLLSHHLYVSRDQHLIYFTYSGGKPFIDLSSPNQNGVSTAAAVSTIPEGKHLVKAVGADATPKNAGEFARQGAVLLARNDSKGAVAAYSHAVKLEPENGEYYHQLSLAERRTGDYKAALTDLQKAAALKPDDPDIMLDLAFAYHAHDEPAQAWSAAQKAKALIAPQSLQVTALADLYIELGHAADAVPLYDPVIRTHREDHNLGALYNGLCWSSGLGNVATDDALRDCKRALKLSNDAPAVRDSLALVLYRQGKFDDALDNYNKVLAAQPKEAWSLYMRGMTETKLGQAAQGAKDRKDAVVLDTSVADRAKAYALEP